MAERNNSYFLNGGEDMGMTDGQYKGFLINLLDDLEQILELAVKAGNPEIQEKVEKKIAKITEMLKF